jgi:hypothetical protein
VRDGCRDVVLCRRPVVDHDHLEPVHDRLRGQSLQAPAQRTRPIPRRDDYRDQ